MSESLMYVISILHIQTITKQKITTYLSADKMAEGVGDENTELQTAALNIPLPTNPDCEGS